MSAQSSPSMLPSLRAAFGERLQENARMANYTTAQVGGPADAMLIVRSGEDLAVIARKLWDMNVPFQMVGSGSNILVSDAGIRGVVVVNYARTIKVDTHSPQSSVWAESGANIGSLARQVALRGLSGLEWAGSVPGTLGGAIYGNAGANGSDMKACLIVADILQRDSDRVSWTAEEMQYDYRTSRLKKADDRHSIILSGRLNLTPSTPEAVKATMDTFSARRRATQPPGASMGSMFRNPAGDFAGRLIESCGLKGTRIGGAEISTLHANFFINHAGATAADILHLVQLASNTVQEKTGVELELEIELTGDWTGFQPYGQKKEQR